MQKSLSQVMEDIATKAEQRGLTPEILEAILNDDAEYNHSNTFLEKMTVRQPKYSKEEFARRGHELYEAQIRSQVETDHQGKIVAIDIETGAFEIANDSLTAAKQLLQRLPDAQIFGIRIGEQAVHNRSFSGYGFVRGLRSKYSGH